MTRLGFRAEPPHGLAALRIALAVAILISPELWQAARFAAQPAALRIAPEELGWLVQRVPIGVELAHAAQVVLIAACAAAIAGFAARLAMLVITLSGLYVFALSQLSGAVIHDMHLFWLSALLSVSPCADALSISRRRAALEPSLSYGVPLQLARCLLGIVYFFPGFWKLATSGTAWFSSDNLRNQLYWKWYQLGREPPALRIDQAPQLMHALALAVIIFELSFIALIWFRSGRLLAAIGGVAFHLSTQCWMGVTFVSLLLCYVVLLPWEFLVVGADQPPMAAKAKAAFAPALCVGLALIAINGRQGARAAVQAWPFGCYPTFDRLVEDRIGDLRIEAVRADGQSSVVPDGPSTSGARRKPQDWARAWQLAGMYGAPPDRARLRAYWEQLRRQPLAAAAAREAKSLRFYAATYSVLPERRNEPPLSRQFLDELSLP